MSVHSGQGGQDARQALLARFEELHRLSRLDEKMWRNYGLRWMAFHYGLGILAAAAAALSAALGGTGTISKGHAAVFAGVAAVLAAIVTQLRASTKWDTAKSCEHQHQAIAEAAGRARHSASDEGSLQPTLEELEARRDALVVNCSAPS